MTAIALTLLIASAAATSAPPPRSAADTVAEFHRALDEGYARGMLELMAPDVVVYEQGFVEPSRDAYANSHLGEDLAFAARMKRHVTATQSGGSGDAAWVMTQSTIQGAVDDAALALENTETMLLRRDAGGWKITHIHWSAHETPPPPPPLAPLEPAAPQTPVAPEPPPAPVPVR